MCVNLRVRIGGLCWFLHSGVRKKAGAESIIHGLVATETVAVSA